MRRQTRFATVVTAALCAGAATHGEWLANHFNSKPGVKTSIRSEDVGLGHFTYFPP